MPVHAWHGNASHGTARELGHACHLTHDQSIRSRYARPMTNARARATLVNACCSQGHSHSMVAGGLELMS